jgi:YidC/Oxa1 family membrane protein insertase
MERRVLFAIFLCFLVLYFWQALVVKPVPKPAAGSTQTTTTGAAQGSGAAVPSSAAPTGPTPTPEAPPAVPIAPATAPVVGETSERDIRVETQNVIAEFTNRGGRLKSWKLKHYLDKEKQPQELVDGQVQPLPFSLRTSDESVNATLNGALYTALEGKSATSEAPGTSGTSSTSSTATPIDLRFEYRDSAGLHALKEFHLDPSSYVVSFRWTVVVGERPLPAAVVWGPAVGDNLESSRLIQVAEAVLLANGSTTRLTAKDIATQPVHDGNFRLAGVDDNYFMTAAIDPGPSKITFQPVSVPPPAGSKPPARELISYTIEPKNGGTLKFFVGPKDLDVLTAIDREFASAINFGRFAVIVVPLLQSLKWVHGYVGNWGWAIVVLTIIINLVMAPLRHKQVVSMRKMQAIQPEVKAIQDRYSKLKATDPAKQKMNQEMMALYREKKVNPAAGCVPMLLTLPIMIAMWAVLQVAIELRGAPWFGWIHDLSAPDPFYVLPILMVVTQFLQQRMTPMTGADPAQQKMMMFMPLVMGFIFFSLPAGALLYYVVGTVIAIGQQYLTTRIIGPPIVRTPRPPGERRAKRVGGGKTDAASGN